MNQPLAPAAFKSAAPPPVDYRARFTADEFIEAITLGAFHDARLELLNGELERLTPPMSEHGRIQVDIVVAFRSAPAVRDQYEVFAEIGMRLDDQTVVGADAALVRRRNRDNRMLTPDEVVLAVEVSNTTLARDLGIKRLAYARAGVPHYWVVDVERRVIHRFVEPRDGDYLALATLRFGEEVPVPGADWAIRLD